MCTVLVITNIWIAFPFPFKLNKNGIMLLMSFCHLLFLLSSVLSYFSPSSVNFIDVCYWCLLCFIVVYYFALWIYHNLFFPFYSWCTFGLCPVLGSAATNIWYICPLRKEFLWCICLELLSYNEFMYSTILGIAKCLPK